MGEDILNAVKAAEILGVSPSTITRLCQRGELQHKKVGSQLRFRRRWLDEYLDSGSNGASKSLPTVQSVLGPAKRFPALRGGRTRAPHGAGGAS